MAAPRSPADPRIVGAITALVVAITVLIIVGLLSVGDGDGVVDGGLTATPISTAEQTTVSEVAAPTSSTPPPTAVAIPTLPVPTPPLPNDPIPPPAAVPPVGPPSATAGTGRAPTADDAMVFADLVAPGVDRSVVQVQGDTGDTADGGEVVVASVVGGRSRIDVGAWTGRAYALASSGDGGAAERVDQVTVGDINGSPRTVEVVVHQSSGTTGESVSLWALGDGQVAPLVASGGCWDGSHTYGIIGATLGEGVVTATCDGSPLPVVAWPSDVYGWDETMQAFTFLHTVE